MYKIFVITVNFFRVFFSLFSFFCCIFQTTLYFFLFFCFLSLLCCQSQWYDFQNMLHKNGIKMADLAIFKNLSRALIFIWVIDMYMVCYGKAVKKLRETLVARYRVFYKNILKKYPKKMMARNFPKLVFRVKNLFFYVKSDFCFVF